MGQYYHPVILSKRGRSKKNMVRAYMRSYDYECGAKLMETAYLANTYVRAFEELLVKGSPYYKSRVVWAGDYADGEKHLPYVDDRGQTSHYNLYDLCDEHNKIQPEQPVYVEWAFEMYYVYIVNHTKKEFVDKRNIPNTEEIWGLHPLPLLTCEGNGRGGGDFRGEHELIGSWARDVISVERERPAKNYKEIIFDLHED